MIAYSVFGGRFRSDLPFPELPPPDSRSERDGDGRPTYTLRRAGPHPTGTGALLGEEDAGDAGRLRLFRADAGLRLVHDRTGTYDVHPERGLVEWHPLPGGTDDELVRTAVLGRVLPVLLHGRGLFLLHASGVSVNGRALGFAAPKGHGKSTVALAMATQGAGLIADDTLVLDLDEPVRAWPGDRHLKVWDDAAKARELPLPARRPLASLSADRTASGEEKRKYLLTGGDIPGLHWEEERLPLAALYFLVPTPAGNGEGADAGGSGDRDGDGSATRRVRLSSVEAAPVLVSCAKLAPLLHDSEASVLLERATRVAEHVPVYAIELPRDHSRLSGVCGDIRRWHDGPRVGAAAGDGA